MAEETESLKLQLKEFFGYTSFRGNQEIVIKNILSGRNTFVIMPTGAGKSLCYQLPAVVQEGLAIVISPLIALMKNQVDQLNAYGIAARFMNSTLSKGEITRLRKDCIGGVVKLLYVAPESLNKEENIAFLQKVNVSFVAIDEAHCISEWGHDFRPEYRRIAGLRKLLPDVPVMALTATAGRVLTLDDIQAAFGERSKSLTANDFVDSLTRDCGSARLEAEALIRLAENVTGGVAKRQAARWLASTFGTLRFEKEFRNTAEPPTARLAGLAALQRGVMRANLPDEDCQPLVALLGELGAVAEADSKLTAAIARANLPMQTRLEVLARMAMGETAPIGSAADRAKAEALKLARNPDAKPALEASPETVSLLRCLIAPPAAVSATAA